MAVTVPLCGARGTTAAVDPCITCKPTYRSWKLSAVSGWYPCPGSQSRRPSRLLPRPRRRKFATWKWAIVGSHVEPASYILANSPKHSRAWHGPSGLLTCRVARQRPRYYGMLAKCGGRANAEGASRHEPCQCGPDCMYYCMSESRRSRAVKATWSRITHREPTTLPPAPPFARHVSIPGLDMTVQHRVTDPACHSFPLE